MSGIICLPFEGLKILFSSSRYFRYAWFSFLLNLVLYLLLIYVLYHFFFPWIDALFPSHSHYGFLSFIYKATEYIIKIIVSLFLLVLSLIFFNTLFFAVSAPYLDGLSLQVEKDFFGFTPAQEGIKGLAKSYMISIRNSIRLNFLTLFWGIILFPLNFLLPFVGFLPGMLVSSYFLGLSFVILPAEHRLLDKSAFGSKLSGKRLKVLIFGLAIYIILLVPFTALLFIPSAIIGGTLLYNQEIEGSNRI